MKKDSYSWWTKRISAMAKLYDIVRIDHFRGFDSFYAIPAKDDDSKERCMERWTWHGFIQRA